VLVGAWGVDDVGGNTSGVRTQEAKLVPDAAHAGDRFGSAVALDGDIALIGAITDEGQGEYGRPHSSCPSSLEDRILSLEARYWDERSTERG